MVQFVWPEQIGETVVYDDALFYVSSLDDILKGMKLDKQPGPDRTARENRCVAARGWLGGGSTKYHVSSCLVGKCAVVVGGPLQTFLQ